MKKPWNGLCRAEKHGLDYREQWCELCAKTDDHLESLRAKLAVARGALLIADHALEDISFAVRDTRDALADVRKAIGHE